MIIMLVILTVISYYYYYFFYYYYYNNDTTILMILILNETITSNWLKCLIIVNIISKLNIISITSTYIVQWHDVIL